MKKEEKIAHKFLTGLGYRNVNYEPDGNIPPDFSINDEIGVEVRRISQLYFSKGSAKSLEEDEIPLIQAINSCLERFDEDTIANSYWIVPKFKRPLDTIRIVKRNLSKVLTNFLSGNLTVKYDVLVAKNFWISIAKRARPSGQRFRIGFEVDDDNGGWVKDIYNATVNQCVSEKRHKIQPFLNKYRKWWLIFVDYIVVVPEPDTIAEVQKITKPPEIERIIFLDPTNAEKTFEL